MVRRWLPYVDQLRLTLANASAEFAAVRPEFAAHGRGGSNVIWYSTPSAGSSFFAQRAAPRNPLDAAEGGIAQAKQTRSNPRFAMVWNYIEGLPINFNK